MPKMYPNQTTWEQHIEWVVKQAEGKTSHVQAFRMMYVETTYAIWMERNQRSSNEEQVAKQASNHQHLCQSSKGVRGIFTEMQVLRVRLSVRE